MAIYAGLIKGKLPGKSGSDWPLLYVELYQDSLRMFEGNEDPSRPRRQIRTIEINSTDIACNKDKDKKRDYRFQYERFDGTYIFKCSSLEERNSWVSNLQKMIQRKEYTDKGLLAESTYFQATHPQSAVKIETPTVPKASTMPYSHHSITTTTPPPPPPHKRDSGFMSGTGDSRMYRGGLNSFSGDGTISHMKTSSSGDSAIVHNTSVLVERLKGSHSDDGKFIHRTNPSQSAPTSASSFVDEDELERNDWYWGEMSRDECIKGLQEKGTVGNFIVRKSKGEYVMSFWRKDGVHHHRILRSGKLFQFEKSVVQANGVSIPDLLDTYMKCCSDKTIGPYGGQLYPNYDDPWNPPEIDFEKMQHHLAKQVKDSGRKKIFKAGSGMGEHTYGGLSLEEMKSVIEQGEEFHTTKPSQTTPAMTQSHGIPTPFAGFSPNASPSEAKLKKSPRPLSSPKTRPDSSPKLGVAVPSPRHDPPSGYVNLFPPNKLVNVHVKEELSDEEEQDVYIAPGEIDRPEENEGDSLYENYDFKQQTDDSIYQNTVVTPPTRHKGQAQNRTQSQSGYYANVTYDGKPITQPRQKVNRKKK